MNRRQFLFGLPLAGCAVDTNQALRRAAAWLWTQQQNDGGWHSRTYGLLKSGQSLTPFVLGALLRARISYPPLEARALAFLHSHTSRSGILGLADPNLPDYPNYSTALAVSAICRSGNPDVSSMVECLRREQFTEPNGWHPNDSAYGAWGMGGVRLTPPETGHVDLSMTRYVLEALRAAGVHRLDPAFTAARLFVERCQNPDGGFHFTTTEADTNKAGQDGERFRSYGTATADGILALSALGEPPAGRIARAMAWLKANHQGPLVPGFTGEAYRRWPQGLLFYYAAATAGFPLTPSLTDYLLQTQRSDGSWSNPENLVKEDDPLIATAFAVRALARS